MRLWLPLSIIGMWALTAILSPVLPLTPDAIDLANILSGPSLEHWLGCDDLGRPVADRLIFGARTSFFVSLCVVVLGVSIGGLLGVSSAYLSGWFDLVFVRVVDIMLAFPGLLLAIALAGALGPGIGNVILALGIVGWVGYARLARGQVLALKHADHVLAAQAIGARPWRIIVRHLLPLITAPLIVEASFGVAGAIIAEADRDLDPDTVIRRTVQFGLSHYPDLTFEEHYRRLVEHVKTKYGLQFAQIEERKVYSLASHPAEIRRHYERDIEQHPRAVHVDSDRIPHTNA